jgi:hypothetical protein
MAASPAEANLVQPVLVKKEEHCIQQKLREVVVAAATKETGKLLLLLQKDRPTISE